MKKVAPIICLLSLLAIYIAPHVALKRERQAHGETRAALLKEQQDCDAAWVLVQELRATVSALSQ
jgi:hypothetical protein